MVDSEDEGEEQIGPEERVSRLSARLVDGSTDQRVTAAYELDEIAQADPQVVSSAVPALQSALSADDESVRAAAALVIATIAADISRVPASVATHLASLLGDSEPTANNALFALHALLESNSDAVLSAVEPRLGDLTRLAGADTPVVRQRAVRLLFAMADSQPAALVGTDAVQSLASVLDRPASVEHESLPAPTDGPKQRFSEFVGRQAQREQSSHGSGRRMAAATIARLAEDRAGAIAGELDRLREHIHDEDPGVRMGVIECFGRTASVDPTSASEVIPDLAEVMFNSSEPVALRTTAATALGWITETNPDNVVEAVDAEPDNLAPLLETENDGLRGAVVGLLAYLAEHDPEFVAPVRASLLTRLDDERAFVRGNAAIALGYIGDDAVREQLVDRAESDPDEAVRRAVSEILESFEASE